MFAFLTSSYQSIAFFLKLVILQGLSFILTGWWSSSKLPDCEDPLDGEGRLFSNEGVLRIHSCSEREMDAAVLSLTLSVPSSSSVMLVLCLEPSMSGVVSNFSNSIDGDLLGLRKVIVEKMLPSEGGLMPCRSGGISKGDGSADSLRDWSE